MANRKRRGCSTGTTIRLFSCLVKAFRPKGLAISSVRERMESVGNMAFRIAVQGI